MDSEFDQPVSVISRDGYVEAAPAAPESPSVRLQFEVPVEGGSIRMIDYASVDSWGGKRVMTWLPRP